MTENTPEPTKTRAAPSWTSEMWGQAARSAVLFCLLAMSLAALLQLWLGGAWVFNFLRHNQLPMDQRMKLIFQLLGAGGAVTLPLVGLYFFRASRAHLPRVFERWAWFLSPFILLPLIPVAMNHHLWQGRHEDFLPIVVFASLIAEVFFSKAAANIPPSVRATIHTLLSTKTRSQTGAIASPESPDSTLAETPQAKDTLDTEERQAATSPQAPAPQKKLNLERFMAVIDRNLALIVVVAAALAYGFFMSYYTVRWHNKLGTATFDLGINNNLLFGGLHGKFNQSTVIFPEDPQKYLANHVKIGIYTFLPIYALFPRPETLLVIQSVSLGLGAIPLFLFARRRLPEWWAATLALAYLAYYPMHGANFYEMKLVPTAAAIVLTCIYAFDAKRFKMAWLFFFWALIMREDLPVPLAVVGAVLLLSGHRPRSGAVMCAIASIWFVLIRFRLMNEVGAWWFPNMYRDLWAEPERGFTGVVKTLLSNPSFTLKHIFVEKKFWYMAHLLVPLAFLPVRRWWGWAALVPGAILTLLVTDYAPPLMFSFQYVMHWSPYLFIAASLVLAALREEKDGTNRAFGALMAVAVASLALSYNYGAFSRRDRALEAGYHKITFGFSEEEAKTLADVRKLVASIPKNASVASTERIGAHLSSRVGFYTLRRGSHGASYIVAREKALGLDRTKQTVRKALSSGEYGLVGRFGDYAVFKKGAPTDGNQDIIDEWNLGRKKRERPRQGPAKRDGQKTSPDEDKEKANQGPDDSAGEQETDDEDEDDNAPLSTGDAIEPE